MGGVMAYQNDPVKIDKTLPNYSAQAIGSLLSQWGNLRNMEYFLDVNSYFIELLKQGVKFSLPNDARVITDDVDALVDKVAVESLPYPVTIIEYLDSDIDNQFYQSEARISKKIIIAIDMQKADDKFKQPIFELQAVSNKVLHPKMDNNPELISSAMLKVCGECICFLEGGFMPNYHGGVWMVCPRVGIIPCGPCGRELEMPIGMAGANEIQTYGSPAENIMGGYWSIIQLVAALSCTNIATERFCSYPRALRRKSNKKKLIFEYHVLTIKPGKKQPAQTQGGSHASPRVHLRRGHRREYRLGAFTWVQPCVVGSKELGVVHKDYQVEPRKQIN